MSRVEQFAGDRETGRLGTRFNKVLEIVADAIRLERTLRNCAHNNGPDTQIRPPVNPLKGVNHPPLGTIALDKRVVKKRKM